MSFTRTRSGLTNLALFCGVDLIVYTEGGGESFSFKDVIDGKFNSRSVDIKFWCGIFSKNNFDKSIQYRALGSKTSLREMCGLIVRNEISNVVVALDSDLDEFIGGKYESPFILYTRGYSWENDVYHPDLVKEQIADFIFADELPLKYVEVVDSAYQKFEHHTRRLLKIEMIFRQNGFRFITDCGGERFISGKSFPQLKLDQILTLIKHKKQLLPKPVRMPEISPEICSMQYCYGKLREALALSLIAYIVGKLGNIKSFPKYMIEAVMIERYRNRLTHTEDHYYSSEVANLAAA